MNKNEEIAEIIAESLIFDFNYLSQKPLYYHFSNLEDLKEPDNSVETKLSIPGEFLKKKIYNTILEKLKENDN